MLACLSCCACAVLCAYVFVWKTARVCVCVHIYFFVCVCHTAALRASGCQSNSFSMGDRDAGDNSVV